MNLFLLLLPLGLTLARNPGVKFEVKTQSLDYLTEVAVQLLELNLKNVKIPNVISKPGFLEYGVTNIVMDGFSVSENDIKLTPVPGTGIQVEVSNAYLNLQGDYFYKLGIDHHTGQLNVQMSKYNMNLVLVLGMTLGKDARGRPSVKTQECEAKVGSISTHFSGGVWNSFINLFRGLIDLILKPKMGQLICEQVQIDVDTQLDNFLRKMSMELPVIKGMETDLSLTRAPVVTQSSLSLELLGQTFLTNEPRPIYAPHTLPPCPVTDRMFHLLTTEEMINTALNAIYDLGLLSMTIDRAMIEKVSPANAHYLNISCTDFMCLGAMLPTVNAKFGDGSLWINVTASGAPNMTFDGNLGAATLNLDLNLDMRAEFPDSSVVPIFDLDLAVGIIVTKIDLVTVNSTLYKLALNIDSTTPQTSLKSINVANVTADNLQGLFQFAVGFGVGKANDSVSQGVAIPVDHHLMLENVFMKILEKTFFLAVNVAIAVQ